MRKALALILGLAVSLGCSSGVVGNAGGNASVSIVGKTFAVSGVTLSYDTGDGAYFRIEGDDAAHRDEDCLPGLGGGLALYGDLPPSVKSLPDLAGKELPFEFTGDGDDANLCFVGSNGLLGVEHGTVRFNTVEGSRVEFSFSGSFVIYDGEGGRSPSEVTAEGRGVAQVDAN